ncbi:MAG: hypothetical protein ACRD0G_17540, partial [Acidimicrobiales bacterium]
MVELEGVCDRGATVDEAPMRLGPRAVAEEPPPLVDPVVFPADDAASDVLEIWPMAISPSPEPPLAGCVPVA